MSRRQTDPPTAKSRRVPPPPLSAAEWDIVVAALRLSPQQAKVVALILQGMRDKQIAAALGINIWTVRTHLTRIFARLGIGDRVELVVRVFVILRGAAPAI